ncbi:MAG TPA: hypothetical protein VL882_20670 [Vicinamibacterales bacterium]|jgi:hypothetical protein|nr:hypothetical protein [Vicinamibacterales bacterium]
MIRHTRMVRWLDVASFLVLLWSFFPAVATAQVYIGRDIPHRGNLEISGGAAWSGGYDLGSASAEETRNTGTGTGPFVLFSTDSEAEPSVGLQGRLGVFLASSVSIEGGVYVARPDISTRLSGDAESAPDLTATETLTRLVIDGSVLFHLTGASFGQGRGVPFVLGGGGYLRDAHEKNEVIETGHEVHVGGGLHYWFGQGKHRVGVRADAAVSWRTGGADGVDTTRTMPMVAGSIAYLF